MAFKSTRLEQDIIINRVVTIHYFEYFSDFSFPGESHDFWEFLCVDKGEVIVKADEETHILKKGDVIFHKPNEFHDVLANGLIAPNLVVISFKCNAPVMKFFEKKIMTIGEEEQLLLANIIAEARQTFSSRLDDPYSEKLEKKSNHLFGSEQMIKIYLEHFLLNMIRRSNDDANYTAISSSVKNTGDSEIFNKIVLYMQNHLDSHVTIEKICKDNLIGRSHLQKIFRKQCDMGIIEYFSKMKIDNAKHLIRSNRMNFTQIAEELGYTSIHYFSRQFKQITGMTPSEYASSIMAISERRG
ncbi:MAG: AraC family transcriptional regulator [Lachnospiraceae bacterium]|nr:AraC family transcriptional regulator [Lachnospiraceae bacterium]MDD3615974.1 AraC family transcriptional regulator [Lachnospiraceae bacterium]